MVFGWVRRSMPPFDATFASPTAAVYLPVVLDRQSNFSIANKARMQPLPGVLTWSQILPVLVRARRFRLRAVFRGESALLS